MNSHCSFGVGRRSHAAAFAALLVLMAFSSCYVHADQLHKHLPNRRRALTKMTRTKTDQQLKKKTGRKLQWPWPEGRDGHKITNDSRDTLEPTPSPTKEPTRAEPTVSLRVPSICTRMTMKLPTGCRVAMEIVATTMIADRVWCAIREAPTRPRRCTAAKAELRAAKTTASIRPISPVSPRLRPRPNQRPNQPRSPLLHRPFA